MSMFKQNSSTKQNGNNQVLQSMVTLRRKWLWEYVNFFKIFSIFIS